ncbi:MAG: response regulator [Chitinivibrionales bacterium]|nr:response regulator [Chitinivibrionales bacterium]
MKIRITLLCTTIFFCAIQANDSLISLRVGVYNFYPLSHTTPLISSDQTAPEEGVFIALLNRIANKENWHIDYVPGTLQECFEWLEDSKLDILVAAPYSNEAHKKYDFTKETVISTWAKIYVPSDKSVIQTILDFEGKYLGVVKDDPYNHDLRALIKGFNIRCHFVEFSHYDDIFKALENKWIDAGAVDRLFAVANEDEYAIQITPIILSPVQLRFAAPKNAYPEVLTTLDYNIGMLKDDPYSYYYTLINRMLADSDSWEFPRWIIWAGAAGIALLLIFVLTSIVLRRQIKKQTAELSQKNRELKNQIAMRSNAEEAMRQSHQLLRNMIASMRDGLIVITPSGDKVLSCNRAAADMLLYSHKELMLLAPPELHADKSFAEAFIESLHASVSERGFHTGEYRLRRKDGSWLPAEIVVTPIKDEHSHCKSWVIVIRDETLQEALRESELRLRQAQKMEAIGTLAGGIAHDFNNILMPIMGYSELLLKFIPDDHTNLKQYVNQILQAAQRARDLAMQILTFGRKSETQRKQLHLNLIIKEVLKLLRASFPTTIEIKSSIETDEDSVIIDPTEFHQVIMNLCTNAAHAMRTTGGVLEVILCEHKGPILGWSAGTELKEKEYIRLSVQDSGSGIDPAVLNRIFDPFFTTKGHSEGTGMGLAVVHGIVKSCDGAISVENRVGEGATFHVYLPKSPINIQNIKNGPVEKLRKGNAERILFIDDEQVIVDLAAEVLTELGYCVTATTNNQKALNLFRGNPRDFDLVITDQTMPGMTGGEIAKEVLLLRPDMPVILCTGFSETLSKEQAKAIGIAEYIMKPFEPTAIGKIVRDILDKKVAGKPSVSHNYEWSG